MGLVGLVLLGSRSTSSPAGRTFTSLTAAALETFGRPFVGVARTNYPLHRKLRYRVRAGDTLICLGDIGHPDAWRDRHLVLDFRSCPGDRFLVLGNHIRAERHPDADLTRPLGDAVADNAVQPDCGQCQCQHPERREDKAETCDAISMGW